MEKNKTIKTPSGNSVELKAYFTGYDQRAYRRVLLSLDNEKKADSIEAIEDAMLKACVLSIDGSNENVVDKILNLDDVDSEFVLDECRKIVEVISKKKVITLDGNMKTGSEDTK